MLYHLFNAFQFSYCLKEGSSHGGYCKHALCRSGARSVKASRRYRHVDYVSFGCSSTWALFLALRASHNMTVQRQLGDGCLCPGHTVLERKIQSST
eukprot:3791677-Amphidinium_carterae.2